MQTAKPKLSICQLNYISSHMANKGLVCAISASAIFPYDTIRMASAHKWLLFPLSLSNNS